MRPISPSLLIDRAMAVLTSDCGREAELLHYYITSAAQNPPAPASHFANQNFQLGSGGAGGMGGTSPRQAHAQFHDDGPGGLPPPVATDVAPDQSVSTASSGKVAGTV